jgi:16S rRNA (adenine1518-N6/adenine1519-N6)-dimethyltransferase
MTLGEIKRLLADGQIRLTRSLGQSLLHDGNQLRRIVAAAELEVQDQVLEIGPGLGPLTELLLAKAGRVLAIEKDKRLFELLRQRLAAATNLTLLRADALDYLRNEPMDWSRWKLVANLPYSVASPILVELAGKESCPRLLVVTLQWEVAQRLVAWAGDAQYGVLTLLVQRRYEPRAQFKIPASCFFPKPEVDSACVTLARRPAPLLRRDQEAIFESIVKRGFSERRKMMFKLLKQDWPEVRLASAFAELGLASKTRAEAVSLQQFVRLTERLG